MDVSTKQNKSHIQLNWSWVQKPPSFFHILPIRQSWLESSFVWLEQGGDYQWHLSSATYHRSGAVLAHMGPAEYYGDRWDLSHTILEKLAPGLGATVSKITKVLFTDSCRWKNVCPSLLCLVDSTQLFTICKRLGQKFCLMQWSVNGRAQFLCYFPNVMRIIHLKNCQCDYMIILKKEKKW